MDLNRPTTVLGPETTTTVETATSAADGGRMALRSTSGEMTFAEVEAEALARACLLRAQGIRTGDRVVLRSQNSFDHVLTLLALMHLDTSIVLLDGTQSVAQSQAVVGAAGARWVVTEHLHLDDPELRVITFDELAAAGRPVVSPDGDLPTQLSFEAWFRRRDAVITWSSGTRGDPKGVVRSGAALDDIVVRTQQRMGYRRDDVLLPLVTFSHFYGLTLVMLWWRTQCALLVSPRIRLDQALLLGAESGVSVIDATPATYHTVLSLVQRWPELAGQLQGTRMWCVGGAPLPRQLGEEFAARFGSPLLNGYGSSEAGNISMGYLDNSTACGPPLDGIDVHILDGHGNRVTEPDVVGEIVVDSPGIMEGYLRQDGVLVTRDPAVPYRTEDLGFWTTDGALAVIGRRHAVNRLGHILYPDVIEGKLADCGAPVKLVTLPDERRGSKLVLFVEDPLGREPKWWRERTFHHLQAVELPNLLLVRPSLPQLPNGKIDVRALEELARESMPRRVEPAPVITPAIDETLERRRQGLNALAEFIRSEPEAVTKVLTEICGHKAVQMEIKAALTALDGALAEIRTHRPPTVSRMAVFMSSNVLLYSYVLYAAVSCLYTDTVVIRPSGQVGRQTRMLHELLAPVHGLPIEFSTLSQRKFVKGPVHESDVVVFTGTYANAEEVRTQLTRNQLFLFFGQGVNPFIVAPGADLVHAVDGAIEIRMLNSGQDCFAPDLFLVPEKDVTSFVTLLQQRLDSLRYGNYHEPDADYGPLFYESAFRIATDYLTRSSERIVHGGKVDFVNWHVEPTIVVQEPGAKLELAELFSPIFNVVAYRDLDEARRILSDPYLADRAMGATIYGQSPELVEMLSARHTVTVNETLLAADSGNAPFGGRGIMANYLSRGKLRRAEPLLISKAVAEILGCES